MIWLAVSVMVLCSAFGVWWWRVEKVMLQRLQPTKPLQVHMLYMTYLDRIASVLERYAEAASKRANNETARVTDVVLCIDRLVPLAERWLALKENAFVEATKPPPKPEEVPLLPPDLAEIANRESEDWAKESTAKHFQELGIRFNGDWGKVRNFALTDPNG